MPFPSQINNAVFGNPSARGINACFFNAEESCLNAKFYVVMNGVIWRVITTSKFLVVGYYEQFAAVGVFSDVL